MKWHWEKHVTAPTTLAAFIGEHCDLSMTVIKKVLAAGGGWVKKGGKGTAKRARKVKQPLAEGDLVSFYYDANVLQPAQAPEPLLQTPHWGIWYKPVNVLSQGSPYGDLGAMDKQVQLITGRSQVFLVHRLDREASGLMMLAYSKPAAAKLSALWREGDIKKIYQAEVLGRLAEQEGSISKALDEKEATTHYQVQRLNANSSCVHVEISTGRYHQIRRHFQSIGHPLLGDPRYGEGNRDDRGLQLAAFALELTCPLTGQTVSCALPPERRLF